MGFFDFVKNAGKKLDNDRNKVREAVIERELRDLGLGRDLGDDFRVGVDGDEVTIRGEVPNQETREKIILAAGNVDGIARVDDRSSTKHKAKAEEATFHTVERGDTLSKIAQTYLGDASKYPVIFEANKPMLEHPDKIYPGQKLRIPGGKAGV